VSSQQADGPDTPLSSHAPDAFGAAALPAGLRTECWIFDVDGSLVDSLTGTSLRPGARALLAHLYEQEGMIIWWSAGGEPYAWQRAHQFEVDSFVSACYAKLERDEMGCYRTGHLAAHGRKLVFVDDRPEDLSRDIEVVAVSPYIADNPHDRGLLPAAIRAGLAWPDTL
jgi:long-chain acyl-CoA synthetase